jgi:ABC-type transport system involved in multi-copper enzyme maturation permease subunit
MTEAVTPSRPSKTRLTLSQRLRENPVVLKELRSRMRGGRAFILITIYLIVLSGLVGTVFLGFATASDSPGSLNITQGLGKTIFGTVIGLELTMICFIAPALTSGAIAAERERQTYDLLRTTLLSARSLVVGKLGSALSFLLLLLVVAFPLQGLAYLLGGVAFEEVVIAFLMLVVTAIAFSAVGLFVSSFTKSVLVSTVVSYLISNLIVFGIPVFIYVSLTFAAGLLFSSSTLNLSASQELLLQIVGLVIGWFFVAVNPVATAIATEVILIEEQSALYASIPLSNGVSLPVISPWIGYVLFYLLFSLFLIWLSVRFVKRTEA